MPFPEPAIDDLPEWLGMQIVEFELTPSLSGYQAGLFQHIEMLGNTLPARGDLVLHREACAQFEQSLSVALAQLVENCTSNRRRNSFKDVGHGISNRQAKACISGSPWHSRQVAACVSRPKMTGAKMPAKVRSSQSLARARYD